MATNHCSVRALGWPGWPGADWAPPPSVACAPNPTFQTAFVTIRGGTALHATPEVHISDADVERIAQRVAAILREVKP